MKFFTILLLVFLLQNSSPAKAQGESDNWYFGGTGLSFKTCPPSLIANSAMFTQEGCASISDKKGNLLFYTDGMTVWNRQNVVMQNGTGLRGHIGSTQSAVIIPDPGSDSIYYILTVGISFVNRGLRYSKININLNNGLGVVVSKNIDLFKFTSEKVTAVRHANKKDIWVVTKSDTSNSYHAYIVTSTGISPQPVISSASVGGSFSSIGYMKFSPDGSLLCCVEGYRNDVLISKFDASTGILSQTISFPFKPTFVNPVGVILSYGAEFSSDNSKLYITSNVELCPSNSICIYNKSYLFQYSVLNYNSNAIASSVAVIDSGSGYVGALQLAKDGKIYMSDRGSLAVIEKPNLQGTACSFVKSSIVSNAVVYGLPSFIQTFFDPGFKQYKINDSLGCDLNTFLELKTTNVFDSLFWDFGDGHFSNSSNNDKVSHRYITAGTKTIKLYVINKNVCKLEIDTIIKSVEVVFETAPKLNLGADTLICNGDIILLKPALQFGNYLWQDGSIAESYTVASPGLYSLSIGNRCGIVSDNINVKEGVCKVYVPNSFTPNRDGRNDLFRIGFGDDVKSFSLIVYNRYGQIIFSTRNKDTGWDGTFKGVAQPTGTYVWQVSYNTTHDENFKYLKGTIVLLR